MGGGPFRLLAVCRGNISRSPAAEYLFRAQLDARFEVASAGIGAYQVVGSGVDRWTMALLGKRGIHPTAHAARQLNRAMIGAADLILTMSLAQRSWVVGEVPRALQRTFTLREFSRLAVAVRSQHPRSLSEMIQRAAANRAVYPVALGGCDEIADPNGGSIADYRAAFDAVDATVAVVASEISQFAQLRVPVMARQPHAEFVL
ncbi:MAG: hypothetical protein LBE08_10420 [Bifidobacteriaceae bacterium]|jgi:protein-tyrosine phosphatase|nr:hypothetical protein [Bifidobacteriaceae bacterium]